MISTVDARWVSEWIMNEWKKLLQLVAVNGSGVVTTTLGVVFYTWIELYCRREDHRRDRVDWFHLGSIEYNRWVLCSPRMQTYHGCTHDGDPEERSSQLYRHWITAHWIMAQNASDKDLTTCDIHKFIAKPFRSDLYTLVCLYSILSRILKCNT